MPSSSEDCSYEDVPIADTLTTKVDVSTILTYVNLKNGRESNQILEFA